MSDTRLGKHRLLRVGIVQGRVHMKHGVMEVRVRVASRAGPQQALPLLAAQERHVLHQMRNTLLIFQLVHRPCRFTHSVGDTQVCVLHESSLHLCSDDEGDSYPDMEKQRDMMCPICLESHPHQATQTCLAAFARQLNPLGAQSRHFLRKPIAPA